MSQNREPPAYQEYAATILTGLAFRTMSLQDRGLLYTMKMECWVNVRLPQEQDELAKVLGYSVDNILESLPAVMPFFKAADSFITCPELEDYREHLVERRRKQSQGGKHGAAITNSKRTYSNKSVDNEGTSTSQVPRQDSDESLVQSSTGKLSQTQSIKKEFNPIDDSWVKEYEDTENCEAKAYAKASKGE